MAGGSIMRASLPHPTCSHLGIVLRECLLRLREVPQEKLPVSSSWWPTGCRSTPTFICWSRRQFCSCSSVRDGNLHEISPNSQFLCPFWLNNIVSPSLQLSWSTGVFTYRSPEGLFRPAQTRYLLSHGCLPVSIDDRVCSEVNLIDEQITDVCDAFRWVRDILWPVPLSPSPFSAPLILLERARAGFFFSETTLLFTCNLLATPLLTILFV
ncbi:hypothetical protein F4778DRAFT_791358 [Xylariomycetidae sp. FL2044]|nr:hypothetical protein F4778DRAFT_791358 [Xylariomycetidae sp. FL2044]